MLCMIRTVRLAAVDELTMLFSRAGILSHIFCLYASSFTMIYMVSTSIWELLPSAGQQTFFYMSFLCAQ